MVAKSPRSLRLRETTAMVAAPPPLSPTLLRDTVKKVDMCVARLQELQHTVRGGRKADLRTGVRCKEDSFRIKNANGQRSPTGKLPANADEWRRMSLPSLLLGETMYEIVQTSRFTRNIIDAVLKKHTPTTPPTETRKKMMMQHSELHSRRKREKQTTRSSDPDSHRAKTRIIFDSSLSPRERPRQNRGKFSADRVSPRNRPWGKKTVLFPNPLFQSSPLENRAISHKIVTKSPPTLSSKLHVKTKRSETDCLLMKQSTNAAKSRRSFSPSGLAMRLLSPMRKCVEKNGTTMKVMSGLKQRQTTMSVRLSSSRI